jgi:hypothetical protein
MSEQRRSRREAIEQAFVEAGLVVGAEREHHVRRAPQKLCEGCGSAAGQCNPDKQGSFGCTCAILSRMG